MPGGLDGKVVRWRDLRAAAMSRTRPRVGAHAVRPPVLGWGATFTAPGEAGKQPQLGMRHGFQRFPHLGLSALFHPESWSSHPA